MTSFGVAADQDLVIVDSSTPERVGSPEAPQSSPVISTKSCQMWNLDERCLSHWPTVRRRRACSLGLMQTTHGWFSTYAIESTGVLMLLSIKGLRALEATIDFSTSKLVHQCKDCHAARGSPLKDYLRRVRRDKNKDSSTPRLVDVPHNPAKHVMSKEIPLEFRRVPTTRHGSCPVPRL